MPRGAPLAPGRQARMAMEQDRAQYRRAMKQHQEVVEDLVNDLICHSSSFVSTPPDPPLRRHRQRPAHLASTSTFASPFDTASDWQIEPALSSQDFFARPPPIDQGNGCPIGRTSSSHSRGRGHSRERGHSRGASRGQSPATSARHDPLRSHSHRKRLSAPQSGHDWPIARVSSLDSPHAPSQLHPQQRRTGSGGRQLEPPPQPSSAPPAPAQPAPPPKEHRDTREDSLSRERTAPSAQDSGPWARLRALHTLRTQSASEPYTQTLNPKP
jgi:hypothetical protein